MKLTIALLCLVGAVVYAQDGKYGTTAVDAGQTDSKGPQGGEAKQQHVRVDHTWAINKDWSAGGYVQHERNDYGGFRNKDTHAGFQIKGTF